jgi:ABC-type sugar transport system substrate-binding protein
MRCSPGRTFRRPGILAGVVTSVIVCATLAACSSSGTTTNNSAPGVTTSGGPTAVAATSGGASTSSGSGCAASAAAAVAKYESLPTSLPSSLTPLPEKPKAGTIIKLTNGTLGTDIASGAALIQAAQAAGWKGESLVYDGTVADMNAKWQQAVAEHPNAIIGAGPPAASLESSLAASKAAGIMTNLLASTDVPGQGNDLTSVTLGSQVFSEEGVLNADLMLNDSKCSTSAQALVLTLPFPALQVSQDAFVKTVASLCPACKVTTKSLDPTAIDTPAAVQAVVASLEADPSIKYVYSIESSGVDGLPAALLAADISGVKIFGSIPDPQSLQGLQSGTEAWWVTQDPNLASWLQMDTILRLSEEGGESSGKTLVEDVYPLGVLTPENVSKDAKAIPVYPANYEELFKKLWKVS